MKALQVCPPQKASFSPYLAKEERNPNQGSLGLSPTLIRIELDDVFISVYYLES
jgi:hypothetical protein